MMQGQHWADMDGWSWGWGLAGMTMMILFWVLVIVGLVLVVRSFTRDAAATSGSAQRADRAFGILRERYARGEIDEAEYEARLRRLEIDQPSTG
jgi:putative membrane protein